MAKLSRGEKARWKELSNRNDLTVNFMIENKDKLDFKVVCKNNKIDRDAILGELIDYVDWTSIILYHHDSLLEEDFWNNCWRINWRSVSYSQDLTEEVIAISPEQLDWQVVIARHKYDEEFLVKYSKFLDWDQVISMQKLSMEFIENNLENLRPYRYTIYMNQKLDEDFMRKYKDKLDWDLISRYQNLSLDFIEEMKDYVNWQFISIKQKKLTKDFILRYKDKLNIYSLLNRNITLPKELKNSDYVQMYRCYEKKFRFV